jgi:transketolase
MSTDGGRSATLAREIRRVILEQSMRAGVGHIGSSLSVADIVAALYTGPLAGQVADDPERDRFILAKGHAALAVYAALHLSGRLGTETLNTYCADGSLLGVHPDHRLTGIDFSTGSLGQGLSFGVGSAIAAQMSGQRRRVWVLLSDAECNEGSVWEAAMFAGHHLLANLTAIIDLNGQQALGYTEQVQDPGPMAQRWRAAGWDVEEIDGHDATGIATALEPRATRERPLALIARTTFGKGVTFMENRIEWHYLPMTAEQYASAIEQVLA